MQLNAFIYNRLMFGLVHKLTERDIPRHKNNINRVACGHVSFSGNFSLLENLCSINTNRLQLTSFEKYSNFFPTEQLPYIDPEEGV